MQRSVTLTDEDISTAIADYVEREQGWRPKSVRLTETKGDRSYEPDRWSATASE